MSLTDKLTELDEVIWKQYEKVTQYCNKEFGWNKYDLVGKANVGTAISAVGTGVYGTLEGYLDSSPVLAISHLFVPTMALGIYYTLKKNIGVWEKRERHQMENGMIKAPQFKAWRPMTYIPGLILNFTTSIASFLGNLKISENTSLLTQKNYNILEGLRCAGLASILFFAFSSLYFKDQIMTPPKKKKTIPQAIKEKLTGNVAVPQLEEAKYQTIDDTVK